MLTIEAGDLGTDVRGIGTYVSNESITGNGIRPAPYSTDFGVNNFTYAASNNTGQISQPHGIGFVFATALWDLTWALVNQYGGTPDPNLYTGTGGNNIAMHLVIEALKLQPCSPGMIDGRDAILQADHLLYGGIHQCLIWNTFANRGFGYSASQGSSGSRTDQVEAFDLPQPCQTPVEPPASNFSSNKMSSCNSYETINFIDSSTSVPQTWSWDFGDGTTSILQNPSHNYTSSGVYTVQLTVANSFGSDTSSMQILINLPPTPIVSDVQLCAGETASVTAIVTGDAHWKDTDLNIVHIGNTLVVPNVQSINTFYVENIIVSPSEYVGPVDSSIGTGGYHASAFHGALNFTANQSFEIVSAWVNADGAGPRTFYLASGINIDGTPPSGVAIIDQVTVNLVDGPQRVSLNLMVPASGNYNIGGNNVSLFRNNSGANYPYALPGYMTINNSSATTNPTSYYYYLYDLEVRDPQCISSVETVTITPIISDFNYSEVGVGVVDFTDMSAGASDWLWTFGDGDSSTDPNPTHIYTSNGSYIVTLSINGGACEISYNVTVGSVLNIDDIINEEFIISVFPNPADKTTKLILNKTLPSASTITIYSMNGKKVKSMVLEAGLKEISIPLEQLASQLYLLVLSNDDKKFTVKILVDKM
jgi:PKD repeat protein